MKTRLIILFVMAILFLGCRKDEDITSDTSAKLEFSTDSIHFDTVFTSVGSVTRRIKIYNRGKQGLRISSIKLGGGGSSNYAININGVSSSQLDNILLRGGDSLNVFVKVTIDPNAASLPFLVKDSVEFRTNGNYQKVMLVSYGQNAVFMKDAAILTNTTWTNTLPYVIYNKLTVGAGATLTIPKGSTIYFHKDAGIVIAGRLVIQGELGDTVTFSSDRLEQIYIDEPGQWAGLHFLNSSAGSVINYAVIKNALTGIRVDGLSSSTQPKLLLANSKIKYMELAGLYGDNADVTCFNNEISNCGKYLVYGVNGGRLNFKQNTFANLGSQFSRSTASLFFTDKASSGATSGFDLTLVNNIIWGNNADELMIERVGVASFNVAVRKNLIRSKNSLFGSSGNILNLDPQFRDAKKNNFFLSAGSPGANQGENLSADPGFSPYLNKDANSKTRLFPSDLGCYEIL